MSNIIPLGARIDAALPIPLQKSYRDHMYKFMKRADADITDLESISAQRWLSLKSYLSHLQEQDSLKPLWVELGTEPHEDPYPALLQFALFMRFLHLKGELYEAPQFIESHLEKIDTDEIVMSQMTLVTGKPVYINLNNLGQEQLSLNNNPRHTVAGAYLQYEEVDNKKRLYYLIHAKTNARPTLSGHISLDSPQQSLCNISQCMWDRGESKQSNQTVFERVMTLWWLWSTKQFTETRYKEYDIIAENNGQHKQRRLEGAYNRTQFKLKAHHA